MPKKRRKLNKEFESQISTALRKVELISAKINDIRDEDIQDEYKVAFERVRGMYVYFSNLYKTEGYTEKTQDGHQIYSDLLKVFEEEYEI